jgi:CheY-like chemotaxis protein
MAIAILSDLGYRVLNAPNGPAALDLLHGDERIDLLLSDVVMPGGLNGYEVVRETRVAWHDLTGSLCQRCAQDRRRGGHPLAAEAVSPR